MQLARTKEMQELDRTAIEEWHIPGIVLMENAGRGTVQYLLGEIGPVTGKTALVFVGPGNNGGDGLVIARMIHQLGGSPYIVYLTDPKKLKGDAAANQKTVERLKLPGQVVLAPGELESLPARLAECVQERPLWAIVDAMFGTGLQRPLQNQFLAAVQAINELRRSTGTPVVAVDIASGLNSDTGQPLGDAVRPDFTVTYGLAKPGHYIQGRSAAGRLHIVDIGIPRAAVEQAGLTGDALDISILDLLPSRHTASHKGNYGHLLVLAGSAGKTGAAFLSGLGALRIGSGLVTLTVPADLRTVFEANMFEAMTLLLADSRRIPSIDDLQLLLQNLEGKSAMVIGPGIGTAVKTRKLVMKLYREVGLPMVIDADGLNILAMESENIGDPPAPRILTPHPGEMARLTGLSTVDIQADRLAAALAFTDEANWKKANVTTVLKGAGTIICDPSGNWAINTTGNPGMAAGGMGDVLSGVIGGLLAQGLSPDKAARAGVYIHGLAADRLARERSFGYLASEVADAIPFVLNGQQSISR